MYIRREDICQYGVTEPCAGSSVCAVERERPCINIVNWLCYVQDGELNSYPSDPVLSLVPTTHFKNYIYIVYIYIVK